jgi:hypothetical protein
MPQNRQTGAAASTWGRKTAREIAKSIGASIPTGSSNKCQLDGEPVALHCARRRTKSVGVTYTMLERVKKVIGAFEEDGGRFRVMALTPEDFRRNMRPTRSTGASAGKVGIVSKTAFEREGKLVKVLTISE